jgi:hypothetical protein
MGSWDEQVIFQALVNLPKVSPLNPPLLKSKLLFLKSLVPTCVYQQRGVVTDSLGKGKNSHQRICPFLISRGKDSIKSSHDRGCLIITPGKHSICYVTLYQTTPIYPIIKIVCKSLMYPTITLINSTSTQIKISPYQ